MDTVAKNKKRRQQIHNLNALAEQNERQHAANLTAIAEKVAEFREIERAIRTLNGQQNFDVERDGESSLECVREDWNALEANEIDMNEALDAYKKEAQAIRDDYREGLGSILEQLHQINIVRQRHIDESVIFELPPTFKPKEKQD